jgi:hypothetical protein
MVFLEGFITGISFLHHPVEHVEGGPVPECPINVTSNIKRHFSS